MMLAGPSAYSDARLRACSGFPVSGWEMCDWPEMSLEDPYWRFVYEQFVARAA
jgi:hypothetical protein